MKIVITAILSLIVGGLIGGYLAFRAGVGIGGIGGFVDGAQGGVCLAAASAQEQGLASAEQVDKLISATIDKIKLQAQFPADQAPKWVTGAADCSTMMAAMRQGADQAR
jgi:cytochrome c biogenesis protein ResB